MHSNDKGEQRDYDPWQHAMLAYCAYKGDSFFWNKWREANPEISISLSGANLCKSKLHYINLHNAKLSYANLQACSLYRAIFRNAKMDKINLQHAMLVRANFQEAQALRVADFQNAQMNRANFNSAVLIEANFRNAKIDMGIFIGATLLEANFDNARLTGAIFSNANLGEAKLRGASINGANFHKAGLAGANLQGAKLHGAKFQGAMMLKTNFKECTLEEANFKNGLLRNAIFQESWLTGAKFLKADLLEANFQGAYLFGANCQGACMHKTNLKSALFWNVYVDGLTNFAGCKFDKDTDFTGVGLDATTIDPALKVAFKNNIRRKHWQSWFKRGNWAVKLFKNCCVRPFWWTTDYGSSSPRIVYTFLYLAFMFGEIYFTLDNTGRGVIENLNVSGMPWYHTLLRAMYFSVVTMTTLGFGDMSASGKSYWGHILLMIQVIAGYVILGALVTRLGILFTSEAPAADPRDYE